MRPAVLIAFLLSVTIIGPAAAIAHPAAAIAHPAAKSADAATIAAALAKNRLYVEPGVGADLGKHGLKRAAGKAGRLNYPVYVIAVAAGDSAAHTDLLDAVHRELGRPGLYIALSRSGDVVFDVEDLDQFDEIHAQARRWRADTLSGTPPVTSLNKFLGFLLHPKTASPGDLTQRAAPSSSVDDDPAIGIGQIIGYGSLLLIAVIAAAAALTIRGHRKKYRMPGRILSTVRNSQRADFRKELSDDTLGIAARLQELHLSSLPASTAERVRHGLDAYDLAGRIVDDPSSGPVDLAGALVLLRIAERDVFAADKQAKGKGPAELSAVNPLHGEATTTATLTTSAGERVGIPATKDEADDLKAGRTPEWLNDGDSPYFTRETVWASTLFGTTGEDLVAAVTKEVATRGRRGQWE